MLFNWVEFGLASATPSTQTPVQSFTLHVNNEERRLSDLSLQEELPDYINRKEEHDPAGTFTNTHSCIKNGSYIVQISFQVEVPD